jgi:hypothetical protein
LTTSAQGGGQGFEESGCNYTKKGIVPASNQRLHTGRGADPLCRQFFQIFIYLFKNIFFGTFEELGRMGVQHPHFFYFLMEVGDFIFLNFFFPKIRAHLDFHIHHWDFSFMKK